MNMTIEKMINQLEKSIADNERESSLIYQVQQDPNISKSLLKRCLKRQRDLHYANSKMRESIGKLVLKSGLVITVK